MKKITICILATLLLILAIIPAQAAVRPNVIVTDFKVTKGVAEVGKDFTLTLTLSNEGSVCADTILTSVQGSFPFIMKGVSTFSAGDNLCGDSIRTVDIPLRIDPTAEGGFYQLTISNSYETSNLAQYSSSTTINLFIHGTPEMTAHLVNSAPIDVYPGDTATITFSIGNEGSFQADSVELSLKADSPIEVKWAKSTAHIGLLDAKITKTAEFTVEVPKDAQSRDYKLYLVVSYKDENLDDKTAEFTFDMPVKKKALFETADAGTDVLMPDFTSRTARITLANTGTDAARKLKAKVLPMFPISTDGSVRYVEIIEPGKSAPLEFEVDIDKDATVGTYGIDVLIDFEDAQGVKFQDTAKMSLTIVPKTGYQGIFKDYWFLWLVAAIILIRFAVKGVVSAVSKKKKQ